MQIIFDFDENPSAQKALEIIAKQLGGQIISSGLKRESGQRMFVQIDMPGEIDFDGTLIRFCKRSMEYLENLGLNSKVGSELRQ